MKTRRDFRRLILLACALVLMATCLGCETVKGVGRDIKNADQWMRDNAW
ncbi:MAG: hypothetical protein PHS61_02535 [Candidatus Omnitrophica bacterium]|nr:hypothetical protein [Candidatus Omnitrophota bacterium]